MPAPIEPLSEAPTPRPPADLVGQIRDRLVNKRGLIIAGRNQSDGNDIVELARRLQWPVLADHRSGCRDPGSAHVLRHFDSLLRAPDFAQSHHPEVVLRIGEIVSSKATSQFLSACEADVLASRPHDRNIDPEDVAQLQFNEASMVAALLDGLPSDADCGPAWLRSWTEADTAAAAAVDTLLDNDHQTSEVAVARSAIACVPSGGALVVSSSMPVRDVEWFGQPRDDIAVIANRGANGIDGVIATAIGVALSGLPTVCLIGDVATLHDSTALIGLHQRPIDLTVVVVNNDGGGIFSFLPQHELLSQAQYELLFGTPHGTDFVALTQAHGLTCERWDRTVPKPEGIRFVIASSTREQNLAVHDQLHHAVAEAVAAI